MQTYVAKRAEWHDHRPGEGVGPIPATGRIREAITPFQLG